MKLLTYSVFFRWTFKWVNSSIELAGDKQQKYNGGIVKDMRIMS
jgi:hypothetical protein